MGFEQYGGYVKMGYDFSDNWNLWADVNLTRFNAANPGAVDELYIDNDQRITRGMASVALENDYEKTSGTLRASFIIGETTGLTTGTGPGNSRWTTGSTPMTGCTEFRFTRVWSFSKGTA